ncbi:zinc finger BED domain-containing protein RICESLEEPER 2-like [Apium graveolens]|uniref:zinc finger BED domain-containing protein RICESLEEPER 2-like n=1 Tax=Apium graveolens TaxID=4045 RepID=UPI003D797A4E
MEDEHDYQEELETRTEIVASNLRKRKAMESRSYVWEHYEKIKDANGVIVKGRQTKLAFQTNKDGGNTTLGSWIFDKDLAREKYIKMIIVDELPFRFGEGLGFKKFMATVQPMFQIPSRWTVARNFYGMYSLRRNELKKSLLESTQRLCRTTDTWTSNQRINYMCLTAYFIDKDWKLHERILNFCPIVSHKGKAISMAIEEYLVEWEITRVLSITVDNASSNDVALIKLKERIDNWDTSVLNGENLHLRCVAHILNLFVKDGLGLFDGSISKVRNAVKYVRQSPAREYERAFSRYDTQDPRYKKHLKVGNVDGRPTCEDWVTVRKFASFLRIFYDLTLKISGTSYVTSNIFLHEIYVVHSTLNDWTYGANVEMHAIGKEMLEKFEKYWESPAKMNNLLFITVVLDPRHKLQFMVYMLRHIYGEDVGG